MNKHLRVSSVWLHGRMESMCGWMRCREEVEGEEEEEKEDEEEEEGFFLTRGSFTSGTSICPPGETGRNERLMRRKRRRRRDEEEKKRGGRGGMEGSDHLHPFPGGEE